MNAVAQRILSHASCNLEYGLRISTLAFLAKSDVHTGNCLPLSASEFRKPEQAAKIAPKKCRTRISTWWNGRSNSSLKSLNNKPGFERNFFSVATTGSLPLTIRAWTSSRNMPLMWRTRKSSKCRYESTNGRGYSISLALHQPCRDWGVFGSDFRAARACTSHFQSSIRPQRKAPPTTINLPPVCQGLIWAVNKRIIYLSTLAVFHSQTSIIWRTPHLNLTTQTFTMVRSFRTNREDITISNGFAVEGIDMAIRIWA